MYQDAYDNSNSDVKGLVSSSDSAYSSTSRALIQLISKLRSTGAQFFLDLPTIVFIGDQSTGKSSLLEALSSVPLPRSDGTCTRCPTELRLTTSESGTSWTCCVKIRWEYEEATRSKLNNIHEEQFGPLLTDPSQVSDVVSRAQLALLNPDIPSKQFVNKVMRDPVHHEEKGQLKFTRNVVCVDISAPNVSNLTLIDLPGLIRSADRREETQYVEAVKAMVNHYISKPNAIIVCTVSAKQEMENTVVRDMARNVDPQGVRTLGVLTKPDRIEKGAEQKKIDVVLGKSYKLELGYYVVRNRTPDELNSGVSFLQARTNEDTFFDTTAPWSDMPYSVKKRMGIRSLESKLTPLLTERIIQALPGMKKHCQTELEQVRTRISLLPPPLHLSETIGVRLALINVIKEFSTLVTDHVEARVQDKDLWGRVQNHFRVFWEELRATSPLIGQSSDDDGMAHIIDTVIVVFSGKHWIPAKITAIQFSENQPTHTRIQIQYLNTSDDKSEWIYQQELFKKDKSRIVQPKIETASGYSNLNEQFLEYFSFKKLGSISKEIKDYNNIDDDNNKPKTLSDIQRIIEEARGRQLPGDSPYEAKTRLINEFMCKWKYPSDKLVANVSDSLQDMLNTLMRSKFNRFKNLQDTIGYNVDELVQQYLSDVKKQVKQWIQMEMKSPFTLNLTDLEDCKIKHFDNLTASFLEPPAPPIEIDENGKEIKQPKQQQLTREDYGPLVTSNKRRKHERDLECIRVASDVMAYFEIASKRFGDTIPMLIDHQFLIKFSGTLEEALLHRIGVVTKDETELNSLLEENQDIAVERAQLKSKEDILSTVKRELNNFGSKVYH